MSGGNNDCVICHGETSTVLYVKGNIDCFICQGNIDFVICLGEITTVLYVMGKHRLFYMSEETASLYVRGTSTLLYVWGNNVYVICLEKQRICYMSGEHRLCYMSVETTSICQINSDYVKFKLIYLSFSFIGIWFSSHVYNYTLYTWKLSMMASNVV